MKETENENNEREEEEYEGEQQGHQEEEEYESDEEKKEKIHINLFDDVINRMDSNVLQCIKNTEDFTNFSNKCFDKDGKNLETNESSADHEYLNPNVPPDIHARYEVPDTGEIAEIILLGTSLSSIRSQFFASRRAQSLLDKKSVVYYFIDTNRDTSTARDLCDVNLFNEWKSNNMLMKRQNKLSDDEGDILIPQIIVDGVPIGNDVDLQDLEEDADLDWIFTRAACPSCLHEKKPDDTTCPVCNITLQNLIPMNLVEEGRILQMYEGEVYNSAEYDGLKFEYPSFGKKSEDFTKLATQTYAQLGYEELFGTPPPEVSHEDENSDA